MADLQAAGAAISLPPQQTLQPASPITGTADASVEAFQPIVQVTLIIRNPATNTAGDFFYWASPVVKQPKTWDGTPIVGAPGNLQIYGITEQFYELVGESPTGKVLKKVVLTGRALGGLYDWVPPSEVPALLDAYELTREQVPEPYLVAQDTPVKDRKEARAAANIAKLATMIASGGDNAARAMVKAKTGFGALTAGSTDAKSILDQIRQAQSN